MFFNVNVGLSGWINNVRDMLSLKYGDYNKAWVVPPAQVSSCHWTWCNWVNRCPHEIGEGKGQHTYVGVLMLVPPACLTY